MRTIGIIATGVVAGVAARSASSLGAALDRRRQALPAHAVDVGRLLVHEMSYCEGVLEAVERRAAGRPVARVGVRIGAVHRVVADAFEQSFQIAAAGGRRRRRDRGHRRAGARALHGLPAPTSQRRPVARLPALRRRSTSRSRAATRWCSSGCSTSTRRRGPTSRPSIVPAHTHRDGGLAMCLAIPGQVVEFLPGNDDQLALVDVVGVKRKINIGLLEDVPLEVGDCVLIHVGFAMSKVDEKEAAEALSMLEMMGQAFTDELQAVAESSIE